MKMSVECDRNRSPSPGDWLRCGCAKVLSLDYEHQEELILMMVFMSWNDVTVSISPRGFTKRMFISFPGWWFGTFFIFPYIGYVITSTD